MSNLQSVSYTLRPVTWIQRSAPENDVSKDEDEMGVTRGGYRVTLRYKPISATVSPKAQVNHATTTLWATPPPTLKLTLSFEVMAPDMTQAFSSAQPHPQRTPVSSPARTPRDSQDPTDDINAPFPVLNDETLTEPYNNDQNNQADFEREVAEGIMRLMMNVRAWAEARPAYEANQEKERLISDIQQIQNREREQGTSVVSFWESARQRLVGFVASVKSALENLQG